LLDFCSICILSVYKGGEYMDYRIGLIVPSSNTTMETEIPRMLRAREGELPEQQFTFHSSRMRMKHVTPEELRAMNAQMDRCAAELADAQCDVVTTACLVAIMAQGSGFHCVAEGQIRAVLQQEGPPVSVAPASEVGDVLQQEGAPAPVVSSAGALLKALEDLGANRVAIVTPYMRPLTQLVAEYIESGGVAVQDALSLEVSDNLEVGRLDPANLKEHWKLVDLSNCDALVLSACVQMPSLASIELVEQACGLPVLSAATATAYSILRALDLPPVVPGAGHLLSGEVVPAGVSSPG
jgi:maleate isomerase